MSGAQASQPAWFHGWILHISPASGSPNPHTRPRGDSVNLPAASEHSGVAPRVRRGTLTVVAQGVHRSVPSAGRYWSLDAHVSSPGLFRPTACVWALPQGTVACSHLVVTANFWWT